MKLLRAATLSLLCAAVFSAALSGCAPPPERYSAPAALSAPQVSNDFRNVELTEEQFADEALILSLRMPSLLSGADSVTQLHEFYVGQTRYALFEYSPAAEWIVYRFDNGETEPLAKNAELVSFYGADEFVFSVNPAVENGFRGFGSLLTLERRGGELVSENSPLWRSCAEPMSFGASNPDGTPATVHPLCALEQIIVGTHGVELCFSGGALSETAPCPNLSFSYDADSGVASVFITGCILADGAARQTQGAAVGIVGSVTAEQTGINIAVKVNLTGDGMPFFTATAQTGNSDSAHVRSVAHIQYRYGGEQP